MVVRRERENECVRYTVTYTVEKKIVEFAYKGKVINIFSGTVFMCMC